MSKDTPQVNKQDPEDLQYQVRKHIAEHKLFDWNEALTDEEITYLENLLLTFCPIFRPGSIGYEKQNKPPDAAKEQEAGAILIELCKLKHYKDTVGKDSFYEKRQPELWKLANDFLNKL